MIQHDGASGAPLIGMPANSVEWSKVRVLQQASVREGMAQPNRRIRELYTINQWCPALPRVQDDGQDLLGRQPDVLRHLEPEG